MEEMKGGGNNVFPEVEMREGRLEWFKPRLFYFFSFPLSSFFFLPPFPSWGLLALLSSQGRGNGIRQFNCIQRERKNCLFIHVKSYWKKVS